MKNIESIVKYFEYPGMRVLSNPAGLTKTQERILNEIRNNPNVTRVQLMALLGGDINQQRLSQS